LAAKVRDLSLTPSPLLKERGEKIKPPEKSGGFCFAK